MKNNADEGPINDADFDVWNGFEGNHLGGKTSIFQTPTPLTDKEKKNPVNKEEMEADDQFAKIEEYIEGRRTKKREEKAEEKQ